MPPTRDHHALAGQDQKVLLSVFAVVHRQRLAGLEHAHVDPQLWKALPPLERAVDAERPAVAPA